MQITKTMGWTIAGIGIMGIGAGVYFFWLRPKKKAAALPLDLSVDPLDSKEIVKNTLGIPVAVPNWKNPYDMNYIKEVKNWLGGKRIRELSPKAAASYAKTLKNAKSRWDDDEIAVQQVFQRIQDKTQVASISKAFFAAYKTDMWQYLKSFLSAEELEDYVHIPVRKLPKYRLLG